MRKALSDAREAYKKQADKKHIKPKDFNVDDCIYLFTWNLQFWQPSKKLGPKYVGPFPIKRIMKVELDLPKSIFNGSTQCSIIIC